MHWNDGNQVLYQLISSPITHHNSFWIQWASKWLICMNRCFTTRDRELGARVAHNRPVHVLFKLPR